MGHTRSPRVPGGRRNYPKDKNESRLCGTEAYMSSLRKRVKIMNVNLQVDTNIYLELKINHNKLQLCTSRHKHKHHKE
jgi:hypothetical protein